MAWATPLPRLLLPIPSPPSTRHSAVRNGHETRTDAQINASTFSAVKKCSQVNIAIPIGVETKTSSWGAAPCPNPMIFSFRPQRILRY